jgi:hypothetical protein
MNDRMLRITIPLIVFLLSGMTMPVHAAENTGVTAGTFLKIPIGGRMVGMGEAFTAVADDPYALMGNMAGLARNRDLEISFSHVEWFEKVSYEYIAFSKSFFKGFLGYDCSLGLALNYLHLPLFNSYGDWGEVINQVSACDYAITAGFAQNLGDLNAGITVKYINEILDTSSQGALGFNIGLLYTLHLPAFILFNQKMIGRTLDIGFLAENLGTSVGNSALPIAFKTGLAFKPLDNFTLAVDVQFPLDNRPRINTGLEYILHDLVAFRFGYRFLGYEVDSYTMGLGTKFNISGKIVKFDVSFAPASVVGNTLNISLSMKYPGLISDENRNLANIMYYKGIYYYTRGELDKAIDLWKESLKLFPEFEQAKNKIEEAKKMKEMQTIEDKVKQKLINEKKTPAK